MPHEYTISIDRSTLYDTAHYAYVTGAPTTHYPGCYRDPAHHACALAEIARLKIEYGRAKEEINAYANYIMDSEIIDAMMQPQPANIATPLENQETLC